VHLLLVRPRRPVQRGGRQLPAVGILAQGQRPDTRSLDLDPLNLVALEGEQVLFGLGGRLAFPFTEILVVIDETAETGQHEQREKCVAQTHVQRRRRLRNTPRPTTTAASGPSPMLYHLSTRT